MPRDVVYYALSGRLPVSGRSASLADAARGPQTSDDVVSLMNAHIRRVGVLSQHLFARHPASFPGVDPSLLSLFAALHDRSKVDGDPSFMAEHGLRRPVAEDLLELWGRAAETPAQQAVIERLNEIDRAVEDSFFARHRIPESAAAQYRRVVAIADHVDRYMDPMSRSEEFGREIRPASKFEKTPEDRELARQLEAEYPHLVARIDRPRAPTVDLEGGRRWSERAQRSARSETRVRGRMFAVPSN